jgi:hypothetical protein
MSIPLNALSVEASTLSEAISLDFDIALSVMNGMAVGKGHFTTTWPGKMLAGDLTPTFMVDLAHEDLGITLDLANQMNVPMVCGVASREFDNIAHASGRGLQDWTSVFEQLHGSNKGFDKYVWDYAIEETKTGIYVHFSRVSPDGESGYGATINVVHIIGLDDDNQLHYN